MGILLIILNFILSLFVSTVIIYLITNILGDSQGIWTAVLAALSGSTIYTLSYFFLGTGLIAAVIGGIAWLIALGKLYEVGWLKSMLIAFVIWLAVSILSFLPTVFGPL